MKWERDFELGIGAIDRQHQEIFEHLLAIENAMVKRDPWHIVRFHLGQLRDFMKLHFAVEEALFEIIRYPWRTEHETEHARLIEGISALEDQLQKHASNGALVDFFERWFVDHVMNSDRKFAIYAAKEFPALYKKG